MDHLRWEERPKSGGRHIKGHEKEKKRKEKKRKETFAFSQFFLIPSGEFIYPGADGFLHWHSNHFFRIVAQTENQSLSGTLLGLQYQTGAAETSIGCMNRTTTGSLAFLPEDMYLLTEVSVPPGPSAIQSQRNTQKSTLITNYLAY